MAVKIEKETIIGDILDIAPQSAPLFLRLGCTAWAAPLPGVRPLRRPAWCMALTATVF